MSYRRTGENEGGKYKRVEEAHLSAFGGGAAVLPDGSAALALLKHEARVV